MLKAAVGNGLEQLRLQHELLESRCMDSDVALLLRSSLSCCCLGLLNLLLLAGGVKKADQRDQRRKARSATLTSPKARPLLLVRPFYNACADGQLANSESEFQS